MAIHEPGIEDIEHAIIELLREQEVGALATLAPTGAPSVASMHFASDGLTVYLHTFKDTRTYAAIQRDPRVSYTIAYVPPDSFQGRRQLRAIQVNGTATSLTEQAQIDRAIEVSREQFAWLKDSAMFDNFQRGGAYRQVFFRIDPIDALWTDNRVRMLWRRLVTFTSDGKHIAALAPYDTTAA
ncbi:MAG: pyridoxamine 5'-phosphate oxidase family protein [Pseudonocardiaceae bacterium]